MRLSWFASVVITVVLTVMWQSCDDFLEMSDMFDTPVDQISTSTEADVKAAAELGHRLEIERQAAEDRKSALQRDNVGSAADEVDYSRIDHAIQVEQTNEDNYLTKAALQVATGNPVDSKLLEEARSRYKARGLGDADDYYFKHYIAALYQALDVAAKGSPTETRLVKQLCSQIRGARVAIPDFSVIPAGRARDDEFLARPECAE